MNRVIVFFALFCIVSAHNTVASDGMIDGKYKVGKKTYIYSFKRSGEQTAFVYTPTFPDNKNIVFDAVRHSIDIAYGKNTLLSPFFETVDVQGVKLMKFRAKNKYILVTLTKDRSNGRVFGWCMFQSDK
jgi:hypothetical protein